MQLKPGDRVWVYYCPDLEVFNSEDFMSEDDYQEQMTSFCTKQGVVVDPKDGSYAMEGDYDWELCIAMDDEQEESKKARTFRQGATPNEWSEGPYYGGYCADAVVVRQEAV